jgi:hypothetical protein
MSAKALSEQAEDGSGRAESDIVFLVFQDVAHELSVAELIYVSSRK